MFKIIKYLKIIFILYAGLAFGQEDWEIVARAGASEISVEEFRNRFEFMPHLNYSGDNPDSIKKEFLYSLIAEKLWAMLAIEKGFDTLDTFKYSIKTLEKMLVKDELYKKEVESKIALTGSEISRGISRIINLLKVKIIAEKDSAEIFRIYNMLLYDADFDSIILIRNKNPETEFEVTLGKLQEEYLEDILYNLNRGEISEPVRSGAAWYIFKIADIIPNPAINPSNEHAKNSAIKILRERKEKKIGGDFIDKIIGGKTFTADRELFNIFSDSLTFLLKENFNLSDTSSYELGEPDLLRTLYKIDNADLSKIFISFDGNNLTLKDFVYYLVYQKIKLSSADPFHIKKVLNLAVKEFIEDEVLANEGFKLQMNELSSVKKDIKIWGDYYLSLLLMEEEAKNIKITENDISQYLLKKGNLPDTLFQINIIEVLTDKIDNIELILNEIQMGVDFRELAKKYNQREATKNSDGEWGLFPVSKSGEIGRIASEMEPGEIYGPLKLPEGYSIFRLIEKKLTEIIPSDSLEVNREFLRFQLTLSKMNEVINNKSVELAEKFGVNINHHFFKEMTLSDLNTFTYRFIGFGGKIAAFPITTPMYEWYKMLEKEKELQ